LIACKPNKGQRIEREGNNKNKGIGISLYNLTVEKFDRIMQTPPPAIANSAAASATYPQSFRIILKQQFSSQS